MSLEREHLSSDGLDNLCQVDKRPCSNYVTPTEEQKGPFVQLGGRGSTDGQDSSESDTRMNEGYQAVEELEGKPFQVNVQKEKVEINNVVKTRAQSSKKRQQSDSSAAIADFQHESNTNTNTRAHTQESNVKISDINVGQRFRKDPGKIDDLVESIRKNDGLLCPVTVTRDYLLIDGLRRIEACKQLNLPYIPVHIVGVPIKEYGEIDANLVRKDFSIEEKVAIKRYRESIEPNLQGQRNDLELRGKFPRSDNKQRRDERIAESTGVSYKTLQKMQDIVEAAQQNPQKFGLLLRKCESGQTSVSKASKMIENENKRQEILEKARTEAKYNNDNDNLKLYCGDFRDVCGDHIPDASIDLIFTDPPYAKQYLYLYQELANKAPRMLKEGGSLVMYAAQYALPEICDYMKSSELKFRWPIAVIHTGSSDKMFSGTVMVTYKPLLWYFKGTQPKILAPIKDSIISKPPDKSLDPWAQSPVEAEHVISKLTIPNDIVLDCMMGTGTTGIAAHKLKRKFVGIELNSDTFAIARDNISEIISSDKKLQGDNTN